MSDYESRAADHRADLIAEDQAAYDYLNGHEWCSGHDCQLSDDPTECPLWLDPQQAFEDREAVEVEE